MPILLTTLILLLLYFSSTFLYIVLNSIIYLRKNDSRNYLFNLFEWIEDWRKKNALIYWNEKKLRKKLKSIKQMKIVRKMI